MTRDGRPQQAKPRWIGILRAAFLISTFVALALFIRDHAEDIGLVLANRNAGDVIPAAGAALAHVICGFLAWRMLIESGVNWAASARVFFLSQLGKYLPGGIWQFVAAAEFGRDAGLPRRISVASFGLALICSLASGAAIMLLALPSEWLGLLQLGPWPVLLAIMPLAALFYPPAMQKLASLAGVEALAGRASIAAALAVSIVTWLFGGLHLWLLANGLGLSLESWQVLPLAGAYAAAWITGFLVFIAPAGVGAREATLIALLTLSMPLPEAAIIALLSRVLMTIADVLAAGLTLALTRAPNAPEEG